MDAVSTLPVQVVRSAAGPTTGLGARPLPLGRAVESRGGSPVNRWLTVRDPYAVARSSTPQVVLAVDVGAVVYDDLDLRNSAGGLPAYAVGRASLILEDPYGQPSARDRGTLIDRYV